LTRVLDDALFPLAVLPSFSSCEAKDAPNSTRQSIFGSIERSSRLDEIAAPVVLRLAFQTTTYLVPSAAPGADTFDWAEQPPEYEHFLY